MEHKKTHKKTPQTSQEHREALILDDYCPECGGELDTGYECIDCGFDAREELNNYCL